MKEQIHHLVQLMHQLRQNQGDVVQEIQTINDSVAQRFRDSASLEPPHYTGSSQVDADRWLDRFQPYSVLVKSNDHQKCITICLLLIQGQKYGTACSITQNSKPHYINKCQNH